MTKNELISYWKETGEDDFASSKVLFHANKYTFCLFTCHLSIEKLLKAHWVKDNIEDFPPRTHNLIQLLSQTNLIIEEDDIILMREMNNWNIEGRYPDYQRFFYQLCTREYVEERLLKAQILYECLIQQLL